MTKDQQMYMEIGRILMAHKAVMDLRFHLNVYLRESGHNLAVAKQDYMTFGIYEDCGPSYESAYEKAKGIESGLKLIKEQVTRKEKYVKLLKHEFKSLYPENYDVMVQELERSIIKVSNYLNEKLNSDGREAKKKKRQDAIALGQQRELEKKEKKEREREAKAGQV